jgi:hypothetical protein
MPDRIDLRGYLFFSLLEFIKIKLKKPFGKSIIKREIFEEINGYDQNIKLGENIDILIRAQNIAKKLNLKYYHLTNPIYCSLRRFDEQGYFKIAVPWLIAYVGIKSLNYKTYSDIEKEHLNDYRFNFNFRLLNYFHSYILYPILEKLQKRNILSKLQLF